MPEQDTIDFLAAQQRFSRANAVLSLNDDPERAARAAELAEATGADPSIVYGDLDNWEAQHKAGLTNQIIEGNSQLRDYANAAPLNAKLSNDDWGALDAVSNGLKAFATSPQWAGFIHSAKAFKEGAEAGFDAPGFAAEYEKTVNYIDNPVWKVFAATNLAIYAPDLAARTFNAAVTGVSSMVGQALTDLTGSETQGRRLARDFNQLVQASLSGQGGFHLAPELQNAAKLARKTTPYFEAGKEPPAGLDPLIDEAKAKQSAEDIAALEEAEKLAQQSATRERAPNAFADFIRQHTDAKIGVNADMVRVLYGDKVPAPDDGLLGFVPDLAQKLEVAEATGGDVEIALADWLAKVEPEVSRALKDGIRVREDGVSAIEAVESSDRQKLAAEQAAKQEAELSQNIDAMQASETALAEQVQAAIAADDQVLLKTLLPAMNEVRAERIRSKAILEKLREKQGFEVYHGSPHEFDAFDIGKIGTGEGTQSYGHGLYFAEEREVSKRYAEDLAAMHLEGYMPPPAAYADPILGPKLKVIDAIINELEPQTYGKDVSEEIQDRYMQAIEERGKLYDEAKKFSNITPNLYRVRIKARPEQFLDHDVPLNQQAPEVQQAVAKLFEGVTSRERVPGVFEWLDRNGVKFAGGMNKPFDFSALTGEGIQKAALLLYNNPKAAAEAMHEAGIPGIRFLDQGSRKSPTPEQIERQRQHIRDLEAAAPAGEGPSYVKESLEEARRILADLERSPTRNYVLFTDKIIEVLDRNGEAVQGVREAARLDPVVPPTEPAAGAEPTAASPFPQKPGWMSAEQYARYLRLIDKRNAEDAAASAARAEKEIRRRQSAEWKQQANAIRTKIAAGLDQRPEMQADEFFRSGSIGGVKLTTGLPKLGREYLTPEQIADLPERYTREGGLDPDAVAQLFGYDDGKAMLTALSQITRDREDSGKNYAAWRRSVIERETAAEMERQHGQLEANILEEAKEHVLGDTQMDLLHEDVLAMGLAAGAKFPISRAEFEGWVRERFAKATMDEVSSDRFLRDAGTAGRRVEDALLKGDIAEAFRQRQRQYIAVLMAREAQGLEREQAKFDKLAKRFSKRESPSITPEYTNWIHDILMRVGKQVKRSVQDLEQAISAEVHPTLKEFVEYKEGHDLLEVPVADFLLDPAFRKPVEQLTTEEFRAMHDSLKTLQANGRAERKILKAGEEADLAEVKQKMIEQLQTFTEKHYDAEGKRWLGPIPPAGAKVIRTYLASHLQLESVFNRWDRGDPKGIFTQTVMRELTDAANAEAALERRYSRLLVEVADKANLGERIDNPLFIDPLSKSENDPGFPMQLTRKHLRAILLNAGNEGNLAKLAKGYGVEPEQVKAWLDLHATPEDWAWAQKIGDIFAGIKADADRMYMHLSGVAPESIDIKPIDTPHGQLRGWYYPVIYHPVFEGLSRKLMGGDALEQTNYNRATTPRGYTKARTGYVAPLALDLDMMPVRMRQMLHDIAMRPAVINASKIFYDRDVRAAITKHYGLEYREQLVPYLRDVANAANYRSDAQSVAVRVSEFLRQNMIATLIGLNPGTVLKHGPTAAVNSITEVGTANFLKAAKGLFSINEATGETNWRFAMETSEELQRRHRNWHETLGGAQSELVPQGKFMTMRENLIKLGSTPVAISDLLSAVPTWLAQYEKSMGEHGVHGDAIYEADRAVRRAHGSTAITNRPEIARGGPMGAWLSSLYGFFNHIMNRQFELAWKAKDTLGMVREGDLAGAKARVPELTAGLFSYVLFPALIEELVTPLPDPHHESWGMKAAKGLAYTISSSWIGIRDLASAMLRNADPSVGLITTGLKTVTDLVRDVKKDLPMSKRNAGMLIQHFMTAIGAASGLTNAQEGKTARYIYNYATGQERPKSLTGLAAGLRFGTSKHHTQ